MEQKVSSHMKDFSHIALLYQQHAPLVFAYLRRRVSSQEDAEDLLLEVFLAAIEQDNFSELGTDQQLAWLRRVAHHKLVDSYRFGKIHKTIALEQIDAPTYDEDALAPEQAALRHEEQRRLHLFLERLPALHQQILQLRFVDWLRCSEIAHMLGKSEGAVRIVSGLFVRPTSKGWFSTLADYFTNFTSTSS